MNVGVLTVSDSCYRGAKTDTSGSTLRQLLTTSKVLNVKDVFTQIVPDEPEDIKKVLLYWCDERSFSIIFTTGGTGFSGRDITPEVVKQIIHRDAPGISLQMIMKSLNVTPLAMLSRPVCGIRHKTLIITFPGSRKASEECLGFVMPALQHAVELLNDCTQAVQHTHEELQGAAEEPVISIDVTKRNRKSPFPLISVHEAQKKIFEETFDLPTKKIRACESFGYAAAEDIRSNLNLPPFPASIKDGYAVIARDGAGLRAVIGASTAGAIESHLPIVSTRLCVRINTGAPIPSGADAVVQVEDTKLVKKPIPDYFQENQLTILTAPVEDDEMRPVGFDIHRDLILEREDTIRSHYHFDEGLQRSTNSFVSLLSMGTEIKEDSKVNLEKVLKKYHFEVFYMGRTMEDVSSLEKSIRACLLGQADTLMVTGDLSMKEKDVLKNVLVNKFGAKIHYARVFLKHGKATAFATCQFDGKPKLIICVPPNPVAETLKAYLYLIRVCKKLNGFVDHERFLVYVQIDDDELKQSDDKEERVIDILTTPKKGQDIRPPGSDISVDQLLIEKHAEIDAAGMGIMASGGVENVTVHTKPVVALLSTGNEIQDATVFPLKKDHIYDSNKVTLRCILEKHGFDVVDGGVAKDKSSELMKAMKKCFRQAEILVTTGGVSMGEMDLIKPVLEQGFGAQIHFGRVLMKPGKPTTFATCEFEGKKKFILGLPGNPVSATVTSYLFLIPLCRKMSGFKTFENTIIKAKLSKDTKLDPRPEYQRCVINWSTDDGIPEAHSTGNQISSRLLSMSSAQVLLQLPAKTDNEESLAKGTIVSAILIN